MAATYSPLGDNLHQRGRTLGRSGSSSPVFVSTTTRSLRKVLNPESESDPMTTAVFFGSLFLAPSARTSARSKWPEAKRSVKASTPIPSGSTLAAKCRLSCIHCKGSKVFAIRADLISLNCPDDISHNQTHDVPPESELKASRCPLGDHTGPQLMPFPWVRFLDLPFRRLIIQTSLAENSNGAPVGVSQKRGWTTWSTVCFRVFWSVTANHRPSGEIVGAT